jgi:hypothetical protein
MRIIRKYKEKEWRPKAPLESLGFARFRCPAKVGGRSVCATMQGRDPGKG